jgi:uncharacterized RDD family membrane protein YckC
VASIALDQGADRSVRALVTPEGVDLRVRLAGVSERGIALVIDMSIIVGFLILLTIGAGSVLAAMQLQALPIAQIIWMLGFFLLRNFYFTLFECGRRSATPGKRIMGLRVVARDGAALSADAVIARNAMRELELYIPLFVLLSRGEGIEAWIILAGTIWCGVFVLFPLFNRDRLRAGDLIAGTWVLRAPRQTLLPDLAGDKPADAYVFTPAQLDAYGVKELQVLEAVLRASEPGAITAVAEQIRVKIGWKLNPNDNDKAFLNAYYAALRRRLEQRLLFGVRKKDKHDNV